MKVFRLDSNLSVFFPTVSTTHLLLMLLFFLLLHHPCIKKTLIPKSLSPSPSLITLFLSLKAMAPALFDESSKRVCVMDASDHFGFSLVQSLLHRGYIVHAAIQNHDGLELMKGISDGNQRLKVFRSDPLDYHSIVDALKGCSGLFYSFHPPSDHSSYDELMAEIEVRAAHNVLEACAQTETMDKVVFSSSITAVIWTDPSRTTSSDFDERHWTDVNFCRKFKLWHGLSKTLAEKTAWALAMDRGVTMVTINSGLLMGPDLTIKNPYLKGAAEMIEDGVFVTVDLDFLVDAHICVFEDISSYGRHLCFNHVISCSDDAIKLARMLSPPSEASSRPQRWEDTKVYQQRISNKKLNKLMVDFDRELLID